MTEGAPDKDGTAERQRRAMAVCLAVALAIGLGVAVAIAASLLHWDLGLSTQEIENVIRSWGAWGVLASVGLMIIHSFVPFPAEMLALANGMVYGPLWGTAITWAGAMLGAALAFWLARRFGRPFVEIVVARRNWQRIDAWTARDGAYVALVSRFIPVIAFNLINYAAGLSAMSWWTFLWTTGIGILPLTVLMVFMGHNVDQMAWQAWLLVVAGAVILWLALRSRLRPPR